MLFRAFSRQKFGAVGNGMHFPVSFEAGLRHFRLGARKDSDCPPRSGLLVLRPGNSANYQYLHSLRS